MDLQDIIALSLVAAAAVYAGRSLWRTLNGKTGCASNCHCADKPSMPNTNQISPPRGLKRIPLVTLGPMKESEPSVPSQLSHSQ